MTDSSDSSLQVLSIISLQLNRIVPIVQLVLGTFGNIMNILIFTRRSLRTNPCSLYFLASSINNLFVLYVALLTRLLSSGWKIDPSNSSTTLCKLRIFFVYTSLCLIQWFVVLASLDRYLSSCHTAGTRQWSNVRNARRLILLTTCTISLAHIHTLIWWSVDYIGDELYCNIFSHEYEVAFQIFFVIFSCMLPTVLMALLGVLTIWNVRILRRRILPQNGERPPDRSRSKDRQLISMLLFQVLTTALCTAPFASVNIFAMIVNQQSNIVYSAQVQAFFDSLCRLILYLNPMIGFYIYTLSSRTFRIELKCILKAMVRFLIDFTALAECFSSGEV